MRKHLKAELVPPDHVNPKLSAGISQVIEMMMSKLVNTRYATCADLLTDLRAIRKGEPPVIARNEMAGLDLETVADAEQSAQAEIAKDKNLAASGIANEPSCCPGAAHSAHPEHRS